MGVSKIEKICIEVISGCGIMNDFYFLFYALILFFTKWSTMNMYIFVHKEYTCYFKNNIPKERFLNFSTTDTGGWIILCNEGQPAHCRVFSVTDYCSIR